MISAAGKNDVVDTRRIQLKRPIRGSRRARRHTRHCYTHAVTASGEEWCANKMKAADDAVKMIYSAVARRRDGRLAVLIGGYGRRGQKHAHAVNVVVTRAACYQHVDDIRCRYGIRIITWVTRLAEAYEKICGGRAIRHRVTFMTGDTHGVAVTGCASH